MIEEGSRSGTKGDDLSKNFLSESFATAPGWAAIQSPRSRAHYGYLIHVQSSLAHVAGQLIK